MQKGPEMVADGALGDGKWTMAAIMCVRLQWAELRERRANGAESNQGLW